MAVDVRLKQRLEDLDQKYGGEEMYRIFGPTSLSWSTTDSSRMYMFTSHIKQTLTLLEPDIPRLATGMENTVGEYNNAYKKLKGSWEVRAIIPKFSFTPEFIEQHPDLSRIQIVTLVLYNKKTDTYDMIEKPVAENLTEKFGFVYNTDLIDGLQEGDRLPDGTVLYKSTSYDDHMNYRYGKNARVFYSTSTDTIEDAIVVRKGWADGVKSVEVDNIQVPINDNDVLLNLYGDDQTYLAFPEVGEEVRDSLICATRRINRAHILYDFQQANMRELMDVDTDYYTSKHSVVYDINVYYNGDDEFPDNKFYTQLRRYWKDGCNYADTVFHWCNQIKQSGSHYTKNVSYFRAKYKHYTDPEYKWKNKDRAFNHIVLEFKVKSITGLDLGSKLTGRFGNKGVISRIMEDPLDSVRDSIIDLVDQDGKLSADDRRILASQIQIVDDERMPYYIQDGQKVYADVMCNASGAIRRLNPGQLVEVETNFIAEQVQHLIKHARTLKEKEAIFFKFMDCVNRDESTFFKNLYGSYDQLRNVNGLQLHMMSEDSRRAFIQDVENHGFFLVRPPHKPLLFDDVVRMYDAFPEIRPKDIYIDIFGTTQRKTLRPGVIGYMYTIVLKQNSNKNFSARSTFRVNRSNLPAKDIAKKTNRSSYARTPVRLSEIYNLLASINGTDLAEHNVFTRSSALGRKSLDRILSASGNPLQIRKLKVQDNFTNANADILAAKLKTMGLKIFFSPIPQGRLELEDATQVVPLHFGDFTIYDHPNHRRMYQVLFNEFHKHLKSRLFLESYRGERFDTCWDLVFNDSEIQKQFTLDDDTKNLLKASTRSRLTQEMEEIARAGKKKTYVPTEGGPRKRGRKSKAEKAELERLALLAQEEALNSGELDEVEEEIEDYEEVSEDAPSNDFQEDSSEETSENDPDQDFD